MNQQVTTLQRKLINSFSESGFSNGFIVFNTQKQRPTAMKIFNKKNPQENDLIFIQEIQMMIQLQNHKLSCVPEIYNYGRALLQLENETLSYETNSNFIEMELGEYGDLFDLVKIYKEITGNLGLPESICKYFFAQMVNGIEEIHQSGFVHRDIKPDNIILTKDYKIKLVDYGFTCPVNKTGAAKGAVGTKNYMAPEILQQQVYNGFKADIHSLGKVLYFMVAPETKWYHIDQKITQECKNLLLRMICEDPERRCSIKQIKDHPWLSQNLISYEEVSNFCKVIKNQLWQFSEEKVQKFQVSLNTLEQLLDYIEECGAEINQDFKDDNRSSHSGVSTSSSLDLEINQINQKSYQVTKYLI